MTGQNEFNRKLIEEFRANRESPDSPYADRPLLLLTTIGAKTGQRRETPMVFVREGERNLVAKPRVTVEIGSDTFDADAVVLDGKDRQQLWDKIVQQYPFFNEHQAKAGRQIPVIELKKGDD